jgi:rod shape determining protein RodA
LGVGLINLYSTTGAPSLGLNTFTKQVIYTLAGLVVFLVSLFFDYKLLRKIAWIFFGFALAATIAVKFWGLTINGATRWLPVPGISEVRFQPSEFMKIALVIALAYLLSSKDAEEKLGFSDLLFPLLLVAAPFFVILKQPDMGTALHLLLTALPIFLIRKIRLSVLLTVGAAVLLSLSWFFFLGGKGLLLEHNIIQSYHLERFEIFKSQEKDPNGKGWQINQSKNAIGSGQLVGRGYMSGTQQKYGFLPASVTDFAFSALAEEWGFVGAAGTLALYLGLIWSMLSGVNRSGDMFGSLLCTGMAGLVFFQMAINVAMVTGLIPVVGIPLPYISYGGTSTVMNIMCVAVVLNVRMRRHVYVEAAVKQNRAVWKIPAQLALAPVPLLSTRVLSCEDPEELGLHPTHRLPRVEPWLKHLARKPWQTPGLPTPH